MVTEALTTRYQSHPPASAGALTDAAGALEALAAAISSAAPQYPVQLLARLCRLHNHLAAQVLTGAVAGQRIKEADVKSAAALLRALAPALNAAACSTMRADSDHQASARSTAGAGRNLHKVRSAATCPAPAGFAQICRERRGQYCASSC